jgi:mannitol-1-phosphate/altronate dehydrogenase
MTIREIADELEQIGRGLHAKTSGRVVANLVAQLRASDNPRGTLLRGYANFLRQHVAGDLSTQSEHSAQTPEQIKRLASELESEALVADQLADTMLADVLVDVLQKRGSHDRR